MKLVWRFGTSLNLALERSLLARTRANFGIYRLVSRLEERSWSSRHGYVRGHW